jgi:hypothetical protein
MPQRLLGIGVNEFPVSMPIAAPTTWQGPTIQGTATFTNGSANVTVVTTTFPSSQFVGTDNMSAGQPVYGGLSATGGVASGVTIASITSATVFVMSATYTGTTGTYPYQIGVINPNQSGYSFSTNGNAIEPVTNVVADSFLSTPNLQSVVVNGHYYIPPGQGIATMTSGATTAAAYQYQNTATGTWSPISTGTAGASTSFAYISDGMNFRINNPGTTATSVTFLQTN